MLLLTEVNERVELPGNDLPHRIDGLLSIDHIAIPGGWTVENAERVPTEGLSDHDAYVISATA